MTERPKRIWLLHDTQDGGGDTWCDDRNPTNEPDEDVPATEYVRADVAEQAVEQARTEERDRIAGMFHEEQVQVWGDEITERLIAFHDPQDYDDVLLLHRGVEEKLYDIRDLIIRQENPNE